MFTRRKFLTAGAAVTGGAAALSRALPAAPSETYKNKLETYKTQWDESYSGGRLDRPALPPGQPYKDYMPVVTPNNVSLPWKVVDGVKVYHLIAEEVVHEFAPGLKARCWGYNGRVHGPTIEAVEGDRVRIYVTNKLIAPTTVHWHGVFLPNGMDGVGGLNQAAIPPGQTFKYEWTVRQHSTHMYHSHHDEMTQIGMGMTGMMVFHPRNPKPEDRVDRDFAIMLHEWRIDPGTFRPNPNEMTDFNIFTMNARCFPGTAPLVCKTGDRVRIRIGNLSPMDHHPIHLHGYYFKVTGTDGGQMPLSAQEVQTTVLVPVGAARDIEFIADAPGDWAMHCHMTHHVMNQMGHGIPNLIGLKPGDLNSRVSSLIPGYMTMGVAGMGAMGQMAQTGEMPGMENMAGMGSMAMPPNSIPMVGDQGPFDYITMGGMFNILKVRDELASYDEDPGWYNHPPGTVASLAGADELQRDGIQVSVLDAVPPDNVQHDYS